MNISLELLYSQNKTLALDLFLVFANDFASGINEKESVHIDDSNAQSFINNLQRDVDFPANGGFNEASPFKKAAMFFVYLQVTKPFADQKFTAALGYAMVKECLHKATYIDKETENIVRLENPIKLSAHFYKDLIEAARNITPAEHFKTYSLLFEALAYEANPTASYEKVI